MKRSLIRAVLAASVLTAGFAATAVPARAAKPQSEHDRIVAFWTPERVAKAVPRDFVRDPATGRFSPKPYVKPGGGGSGGTGSVIGASWPNNNKVNNTVGKVLFEMSGSYYVCSATVVNDGSTSNSKSVVLTAGHCIIDESNGTFATNWMFIPNYDAAPEPLTTSGSFCSKTKHGCWTATALYGRQEFASAGGFNQQAIEHDWGFAVMGPNSWTGPATATKHELDDAVGSQAIAFTAMNTTSPADRAYAFGYPASGKYRGNDLVYCLGSVGTDPLANNKTYRLGCNMTGGSSGGGWMAYPLTSGGDGTLRSANSYGYSGITAMHGPIFNAATAATFNAALAGNSAAGVVHSP
jgi:hypothetical protein